MTEPNTLRCGYMLGLSPIHPYHQQVLIWGKAQTVCPVCTPNTYARVLAKHRKHF